MGFEGINVEQVVRPIVMDAVASQFHGDPGQVSPEMPLNDIESLDLQELLIAIEEECDAIPEVEKRQLRVIIADEEAQRAKSVSDLITITVASVERMLAQESGGTKT